RLGGREADAAIAHHDRGDTVPARRRHFGVPRRLPVIMGVDVDEARGDDLAAGVDFLCAPAELFADRDDPVAVDRDIGDKGRAARTIDDGAAANHQTIHARLPIFSFQEETYHGLPICQGRLTPSPSARKANGMSDEDYVYDEASGEWLPASEARDRAAAAAAGPEVRDAVGNLLADGDSVVL